jgi:predicted metal-dependent enzyme (double-stranded beta helix superfamily)
MSLFDPIDGLRKGKVMQQQDWLVNDDGLCLPYKSPRQWDLITETENYRFYRFLTDIEDVVNRAESEGVAEKEFLTDLRRLVRKLLLNCHWVSGRLTEPDPRSGYSFCMLYDEPGFPITIQTEVTLPGHQTPIHNHGTWGVVATVQGQQKNTFWKRVPTGEFPHKIEEIGDRVLEKDDIISFTTEAIHSIEAIGEEPCITLNLYGDTFGFKRFQFDPLTHQGVNF